MPLVLQNQYSIRDRSDMSGDVLLLLGTILGDIATSQEENMHKLEDMAEGHWGLISLIQEIIEQCGRNDTGNEPTLYTTSSISST